jgi:hypothetical protein
MRRLLHTVFLLLFFQTVVAQTQPRVDANAALQQNTIRIGEQIKLKLSVRYREGSKKTVIVWPQLKDTLTAGVEIISQDSIHTDLRDRTSVLYEQWRNITITAFNEGTYSIPAKIFLVDNVQYATPPLILTVTTVPVDTTQPIKDIKEIYDVPPPILKEKKSWFNWWMAAAAGALLLAAGIFVWLTLRKKAEPIEQKTNNPGGLQPHERVLEELTVLASRRLWEQPGELKNHYSRLTEILRSWSVERYRIGALEMTTGEILQHLRYKQVDETAVMLLRDVLLSADAVKFAKYIPPAEDNERCIRTAMEFVQKTPFPAPVIVPPATPVQS